MKNNNGMMIESQFVHLHVHSDMSLLDGAAKAHAIVDGAVALKMPAIALTDHGNLQAAPEFLIYARERGIKPVIGLEVYLVPGDHCDRSQKQPLFHLVLLAMNTIGISNLIKISSIGYSQGYFYRPRINDAVLKHHSQGLIALSACLGGEIPQRLLKRDFVGAIGAVRKYQRIFGKENFYIELQNHGLPDQIKVLKRLVKLADCCAIEMVATNDCHYVKRKDWLTQDLLLCIKTGSLLDDKNRFRFSSLEFFLKSADEMKNVFAEYPQAVANTLKIAERCGYEESCLDRLFRNQDSKLLRVQRFGAKSSIRSIGKILGCDSKTVKALTCLIPKGSKLTLNNCLERLLPLKCKYNQGTKLEKTVLKLALKIEGFTMRGAYDKGNSFGCSGNLNRTVSVKVLGIGGGGVNMLKNLQTMDIQGIDLVAINSDIESIEKFPGRKIVIGKANSELAGKGAGGLPEFAEKAILEEAEKIRKELCSTDIVYILSSFGGGMGTGATVKITEIARNLGCYVICMITTPFTFEGSKRNETAIAGLEKLKKYTNTMITLSNESILHANQDKSMQEAFLDVSNFFSDLLISLNKLLPERKNEIKELDSSLSQSYNIDFVDKEITPEKIAEIISREKKSYFFPFGQKITRVEQKDRTPKKVFVLGVYASAVHAQWSDKDGKIKVNALAVASEPEIFWTGEGAEKIISQITIPAELGKLAVPSDKNMNGPSGRALDNLFLKPLGFDRSSAWLCDLLPESRVNENQRNAISRHYTESLIMQFGLSQATVPAFEKAELNSVTRRKEILEELEESAAEYLILLGDMPVKWFLNFYDRRFSKLSQFGETEETYGRFHQLIINGRLYKVLPLCHPRQAAQLGKSNSKWGNLHKKWLERKELQSDNL